MREQHGSAPPASFPNFELEKENVVIKIHKKELLAADGHRVHGKAHLHSSSFWVLVEANKKLFSD